MQRAKKAVLSVGDRRIEVSNLDKVLYPGGKFSKGDAIDYYIRISKYLLPHLRNRPVTLKRFPDGVFGEFFYEKDAPIFTPEWVQTFAVPRKETNGPDIRYILINDVATLVWVANLASLEIHPFLHRAPRIDRPTSIVFDCDPGAGADILSCVRVAQLVRHILNDLDLESFAKVSGSKGIQVYVPLNSPVTYRATLGLAKGVAQLLERREPKLIISQMAKQLRKNKVFIDWSQNAEYKTTVGVYSLRAKTYKPHVSLPMTWDELDESLKKHDAESLFFTPQEALKRVDALGDLFTPVLKKVQHIPADVREYFEPAVGVSATKRTRKQNPPASKRSRQGSRRQFLIHKKRAGYFLIMETTDTLKSWSLAKRLPVKKGKEVLAEAAADLPLKSLNATGTMAERSGQPPLWDTGTYELIEGNHQRGFLRFYLNGSKVKGEWTLERLDRETGAAAKRQWRLAKSNVYAGSVVKKKKSAPAQPNPRKRTTPAKVNTSR